MARDFSKNTSNYLSLGANALGPLLHGAGAISLHAHVYYDTLASIGGASDDILSILIDGSTVGVSVALATTATSAKMRVGGRSQAADSFRFGDSTTTIVAGNEYKFGGVVNVAGDSIRVYLNGSQESTGAKTFGAAVYANGTPTGHDSLGCAMSTTTPISTDRQTDGRISEVAIWAGDIGTPGFEQLATGVSALMVRPELLVFYMPLLGRYSPEIDLISGKSGTITGTVADAAHPRIYLPSSGLWIPPAADAGAFVDNTTPILMHVLGAAPC